MNVIPSYLKIRGRMLLAVVIGLSFAVTSCDKSIYDYEGDCSVNYRVAFRYNRNMNWADAFAHEVGSVHLYAFDTEGTLVWHDSERGDALAAEGYTMPLDLPAGDYRLVAWCGLENDGKRPETFSVPDVRVGETRIEDLECRLNREYDGATAYSKAKLYPLFHGMTNVSLPTNDDGGDYTFTMDLTKDTNHVRIILQHLSGEDVNVNDFNFRIEEENGLMNYDNALLADEMIEYRAYDTKEGMADLGINDYPEIGKTHRTSPRTSIVSVSVAIADLSIARLTEGRKTFLTVETTDGKTSARIPLTDYALKLKDGYDEEMTDQEYLDRQDEYALTFFLNDSDRWIETSIIINSWKVVINDVDIE